MKVFIGLGNPGKKYENTKHNIGFQVIDLLAQEANIIINKKEFDALTGIGHIGNEKIMLVKPQTYMNLSGQSIWPLIRYYADQIQDFIIIYDDMDLPVGEMRFRRKGSAGGHNGIKSIIQSLGSNEFDRLKIGIGQADNNVVKHVLSDFNKAEKQIIRETEEKAISALITWLNEGIDLAMRQYN